MKVFKIVHELILKLEKIIPKNIFSYIEHLYYILRYPFYIGNNYSCPICGKYFRKFLSMGYGTNRKNVICPRDASLERHRLIWLYLKYKTNFFNQNLKVLHFAPSYCFQYFFKSFTNLDYVSADLYSPSAMVKIDITNILFKDNTFDVIICNHVLEHVLDDQSAIKELYRVLKYGGWAIITCPVDFKRKKTFEKKNVKSSKVRKILFGQEDHVRVYGQDFKNRLESSGFNIKIGNYAKSFGRGANLIEKFVINKDEKIYFCYK